MLGLRSLASLPIRLSMRSLSGSSSFCLDQPELVHEEDEVLEARVEVSLTQHSAAASTRGHAGQQGGIAHAACPSLLAAAELELTSAPRPTIFWKCEW